MGLVGLVLLACCAGGARGIAAIARHRAETAADLAALAGAARVAGGLADACAVAERIASSNGARLSRCDVTGPVVDVEVETAATAGRLGSHRAHARSRAGPAVDARP